MTIADWVAVLIGVAGVVAGMAAIPEGTNRPMFVGACVAFSFSCCFWEDAVRDFGEYAV
jgi:hypothetical protein